MTLSLFLPGCRESALRASRAMGGGAAHGRGRPSVGGLNAIHADKSIK